MLEDKNIFTTPEGSLSWELPHHWSQYDDNEGTYAFFNTTSWTGNLRITPVKLSANKILNVIISEEIAANPQSVKLKLEKYECAFYKKNLIQGNDSLLIYYWITGDNSFLFTCSFVIDKDQENLPRNENELRVVEKIISSITSN